MTVTISRDAFSEVRSVMDSSQDSGIYGSIDRETGEVFLSLPGDGDEDEDGVDTRAQLSIPNQDSRAGYQDMVAFIGTVEDEILRQLLSVAIQGKGAFGRFKDVLRSSQAELQRWYDFSEQQRHDRAIDWLDSHGFVVEQG